MPFLPPLSDFVADWKRQNHERWLGLVRIIVAVCLTRRPAAEWDNLQAIVLDGSGPHRQEVREMIQSMADTWIEEGIVRGQMEGQLQAGRAILIALLEDRFGIVAEKLRQKIDAMTDIALLQAAAVRVSRMGKIEDLQL